MQSEYNVIKCSGRKPVQKLGNFSEPTKLLMPNSSMIFTTQSEPVSFANQERPISEVSGTGPEKQCMEIASNLMKFINNEHKRRVAEQERLARKKQHYYQSPNSHSRGREKEKE